MMSCYISLIWFRPSYMLFSSKFAAQGPESEYDEDGRGDIRGIVARDVSSTGTTCPQKNTFDWSILPHARRENARLWRALQERVDSWFNPLYEVDTIYPSPSERFRPFSRWRQKSCGRWRRVRCRYWDTRSTQARSKKPSKLTLSPGTCDRSRS